MAAVILDVDGTLVDSNDAHAAAWVEAFAAHGVTVAFDAVRRCIGMGGDKLMPAVSGISEESEAGQAMAAERSRIFKTKYLHGLQPFDSVRELVQRFKGDGFAVAVASSAKEDELTPLLEIARVADLIEHRTSSDDAEASKPEPDIVEAALKEVRSPARDAVMVGDTPYDVEAATRAGVAVVGFESGGWTRGELAGAVEVYRDAADLLRRYDSSIFARMKGTHAQG